MSKRTETPRRSASAAQAPARNLSAIYQLINASQNYMAGLSRYSVDFMIPYLISTGYFQNVENEKLLSTSPVESFLSYLKLLDFNLDIFHRGFFAAIRSINSYSQFEINSLVAAVYNTLLNTQGEDLSAFAERQARLMDTMARVYPQAIQAIEPEYGFHFERGNHKLAAETDRFYLYQISPTDSKVKIRKNGKPIIILPPYVLGANILGFLPGENKSYAHCFANRGIPTYIRILKDIETSEALQVMTGEDDARDTRLFCETVMKKHGQAVTLNGYCQGGFSALCDLLSGQLDGLVDAFITCVAPMDGTRSKGLAEFLKRLPGRFNDLAYGTKTLPSGNRVADGKLMGWVYKLKSIEHESPLSAFYRDLMMFARQQTNDIKISKTAAALNFWLDNERNDLPLAITEMSFASYNVPIADDGTLPIKLFGRQLNLKRLKEMGIPWLICYGENDDLVEKETALAPLDYIEAEVSAFPKGHVAMATSWSDPHSACALHTRFGEGNWRGPVLFHLDLERQSARARRKRASSQNRRKAKNG
ncbi:MAG: metal transporter [Deltaproteobacteria bacterium]|nr:metal transporter [Deltaproteobacteria bacterium]